MISDVCNPLPQACVFQTTHMHVESGNRRPIEHVPLLARWHVAKGGRLECEWVRVHHTYTQYRSLN
jgi:hypothetical protein